MAKEKLDIKEEGYQKAIASIEKMFGKGSIFKTNSNDVVDIPAISSGSLKIDKALGIGGIPKGRIIEIFGMESSGKTTLALQFIAEAQKEGSICAFIDAEHALDIVYAKKLGVKTDGEKPSESLLISQPDYGEQALSILEALVVSGSIDLIVVDSVAALTPKAELDGDMEDHQVGVQARMMSKALRKLTGLISKTKTTVIFLNQLRVGNMMGYGEKNVTSGGNALKFYASVRMELKKVATLKKSEDVIGNEVKMTVKKNKVSPPFKVVNLKVFYNQGFSKKSEILDIGVKEDIINKSGSWYSYGDIKIGQGEEKVFAFFDENKELFEEIELKVRETINPSVEINEEE